MTYQARRIEVDAVEFTGGNYGEVDYFMGKVPGTTPLGGPYKFKSSAGVQRAYKGDLIIKLDGGEFGVMKVKNFEDKYQKIIRENLEQEEG